jgi:hypothetical protein
VLLIFFCANGVTYELEYCKRKKDVTIDWVHCNFFKSQEHL